ADLAAGKARRTQDVEATRNQRRLITKHHENTLKCGAYGIGCRARRAQPGVGQRMSEIRDYRVAFESAERARQLAEEHDNVVPEGATKAWHDSQVGPLGNGDSLGLESRRCGGPITQAVGDAALVNRQI